MKYFSILLISILLFSFACTNEPERVTFDAYDTDSRYLGEGEQIFPGLMRVPTGTHWYCASDSAFDYAMANINPGDAVYLTEGDTVYSLESPYYFNQIMIGGLLYEEPTLTTNGNALYVYNSAIELLDLDCLVLYVSGNTLIECNISNGTFIHSAGAGTFVMYNSDIVGWTGARNINLGVDSHGARVEFDGASWYDADCICDITMLDGQDWELEIESWVYDDTLYSYEDHSVSATGAWWDKDNNLVTFTACSSEYGSEAVLYYNLDGGCGASFSTTNAADDNGYDDCSTGTYHWAQVSVTGSTQRVYYKWESTLCDSVVWTSCAMKGKPRTSDSGIPPNPFQR